MHHLESPTTFGYINKTSDNIQNYLKSCSLIMWTINQPLGNPEMPYNNELQLTHKSIIHNLAFILSVIEIKNH